MNNRSYICRVAAQDPPKPQFAPLVPEGPPILSHLNLHQNWHSGDERQWNVPRPQTWTLRRPDDIAGYTGTLPNPKMEPVDVIKELLKGLSKVDEVCAPPPGSNAANCVSRKMCFRTAPALAASPTT